MVCIPLDFPVGAAALPSKRTTPRKRWTDWKKWVLRLRFPGKFAVSGFPRMGVGPHHGTHVGVFLRGKLGRFPAGGGPATNPGSCGNGNFIPGMGGRPGPRSFSAFPEFGPSFRLANRPGLGAYDQKSWGAGTEGRMNFCPGAGPGRLTGTGD